MINIEVGKIYFNAAGEVRFIYAHQPFRLDEPNPFPYWDHCGFQYDETGVYDKRYCQYSGDHARFNLVKEADFPKYTEVDSLIIRLLVATEAAFSADEGRLDGVEIVMIEDAIADARKYLNIEEPYEKEYQ